MSIQGCQPLCVNIEVYVHCFLCCCRWWLRRRLGQVPAIWTLLNESSSAVSNSFMQLFMFLVNTALRKHWWFWWCNSQDSSVGLKVRFVVSWSRACIGKSRRYVGWSWVVRVLRRTHCITQRSCQKRVFPHNRLHCYWPPKTQNSITHLNLKKLPKNLPWLRQTTITSFSCLLRQPVGPIL